MCHLRQKLKLPTDVKKIRRPAVFFPVVYELMPVLRRYLLLPRRPELDPAAVALGSRPPALREGDTRQHRAGRRKKKQGGSITASRRVDRGVSIEGGMDRPGNTWGR